VPLDADKSPPEESVGPFVFALCEGGATLVEASFAAEGEPSEFKEAGFTGPEPGEEFAVGFGEGVPGAAVESGVLRAEVGGEDKRCAALAFNEAFQR
jgi:hypothetical protein